MHPNFHNTSSSQTMRLAKLVGILFSSKVAMYGLDSIPSRVETFFFLATWCWLNLTAGPTGFASECCVSRKGGLLCKLALCVAYSCSYYLSCLSGLFTLLAANFARLGYIRYPSIFNATHMWLFSLLFWGTSFCLCCISLSGLKELLLLALNTRCKEWARSEVRCASKVHAVAFLPPSPPFLFSPDRFKGADHMWHIQVNGECNRLSALRTPIIKLWTSDVVTAPF